MTLKIGATNEHNMTTTDRHYIFTTIGPCTFMTGRHYISTHVHQ